MTNQAIIDYNNELVKYDSKCDIIDYITHINSMYDSPIDLSFMKELLTFVEQDTCCIPHILLVKYGIFKEKNASQNVKITLDLYEFTETEDYLLMNVHEQVPSGIKHKIVYYLKPDTFKFMIMRSKCEKKYAKYYLLLEKSIKYYHDYQITYKEYIINQKDDKIDQLSKKIDNQSKEMKLQHEESQKKIDNQSKEIQELLNYAKNADTRLSDVEDELVDTASKLEDTIADLSVVQDKLDISVEDRAVKPRTNSKINQIAILRKDSTYYIACGQKTHITKTIKLKNNYLLVKKIDNVPNSIYLFDHIKKHFSDKINTSSRNVTLQTINEVEFIDSIESLFDGRRNIDLTKRP